MAKDKKSLYQTALDNVGKDARLQVNAEQENVPAPRSVRTKTLKAIPESYFEAHRKLRETNRTNLDFSNFIVEAIRKELERFDAL